MVITSASFTCIFQKLVFRANPKIFLLFLPILSLHIISWVLIFLWNFFAPKSPAKSCNSLGSAAFSTSQLSAILLGNWEVFARLDSRKATKPGKKKLHPFFNCCCCCEVHSSLPKSYWNGWSAVLPPWVRFIHLQLGASTQQLHTKRSALSRLQFHSLQTNCIQDSCRGKWQRLLS